MKLIKRIADAVNSRTGSLVFFALSAAAFTFFTAAAGHTAGWLKSTLSETGLLP